MTNRTPKINLQQSVERKQMHIGKTRTCCVHLHKLNQTNSPIDFHTRRFVFNHQTYCTQVEEALKTKASTPTTLTASTSIHSSPNSSGRVSLFMTHNITDVIDLSNSSNGAKLLEPRRNKRLPSSSMELEEIQDKERALSEQKERALQHQERFRSILKVIKDSEIPIAEKFSAN